MPDCLPSLIRDRNAVDLGMQMMKSMARPAANDLRLRHGQRGCGRYGGFGKAARVVPVSPVSNGNGRGNAGGTDPRRIVRNPNVDRHFRHRPRNLTFGTPIRIFNRLSSFDFCRFGALLCCSE
jgi:hypothetical protein